MPVTPRFVYKDKGWMGWGDFLGTGYVRLSPGEATAVYLQTAERLVAEHGPLPNKKWLRNNGYSSLHAYMRSHPEPFAHIPQLQKHRAQADCHPDRKHQ